MPFFETFVLNEEPSYSNIPGLYRHQKKPQVPIEPSDMVVGDEVVENQTVEISKKQGNCDFSSFKRSYISTGSQQRPIDPYIIGTAIKNTITQYFTLSLQLQQKLRNRPFSMTFLMELIWKSIKSTQINAIDLC